MTTVSYIASRPTTSLIKTTIICAGFWGLSGGLAAAAPEPDPSPVRERLAGEILVSAPALPPSPSLDAYSLTVIDRAELSKGSGPALDSILRAVPGFTLFRRTTSAAAHPTTQGVTLRGIGPNGAGRTLVLVDGVPANDPFGGWVYWSAIPSRTIERVEIIRGGGAGPWGNAALAGTIRIASIVPQGDGGLADVSAGSRGGFDGTASAWASSGGLTVDATAYHTVADGFYLLRPSDRGLVDNEAGSSATRLALGLTWRAPGTLVGRLSVGFHDEDRGNGTLLSANSTRSYDASLRLADLDATGDGWEAVAYGVKRRFENLFTSVAADRRTETPALDQYDAPAQAIGGNVMLRRRTGPGILELGADIRAVSGETREAFLYQADAFRRDRRAGGDQFMAGVFGEYTLMAWSGTEITGGARVDFLRDSNGHRRESNSDTGATLVDEEFADREKTVANFRLGLVQDIGPTVKARAVAYSGFRQPTINELYRPFRVRNDSTEANPALAAERLYGAEAGLRWQASPGTSLDLTGFVARLENAIANVLVSETATGSVSQRRNLDRIRSAGLEAELVTRPMESLTLTARYLLTAAKVTAAKTDPSVVGKRPPQVARHQGSLSIDWTPLPALKTQATLRGESSQFDDALNSRVLPGYVTVDLFAGFEITPGTEIYATAENLFDREIVTALSSDNLITIGAPRVVHLGLRTSF